VEEYKWFIYWKIRLVMCLKKYVIGSKSLI
jgi:hypothetical protein